MKRTIAIATIIVAVVVFAASLSLSMGESKHITSTDDYKNAMNTDIPVLIIADDEDAKDIAQAISFGTSIVNLSKGFEDYDDERIVFIDGDWIESSNLNSVYRNIDKLVEEGVVVSVTGSYDVFVSNPNSVFASFIEGCNAYAVYSDTSSSKYICHSADGSDLQESIADVDCWACKKINSEPLRNDPSLPWGTEYISEDSLYLDNYGYMNIDTSYFVLPEDNEQYNSYYAHYYQESVPDSNRFTADIYTTSNNTQSNLKYKYTAPGTTSNVSTVSFNYGVEIGVPPSVTYNVGWSYSVPDVGVVNDSNTGTGIFDIWHNVDELKAVGQHMYFVEPAKFMRVDCHRGPGYCYQSDVYTVQFCKWVAFWLEFHNISKTMHVFFKGLPHTLTIDPNGAEEYSDEIMNEELGTPAPDVSTYSEGTFVTLWDRAYYKSGYTCIGYSSNPNSTTAEYSFNSTIQMLDDYTLYAVWIHD
jgi:hypothetical protein